VEQLLAIPVPEVLPTLRNSGMSVYMLKQLNFPSLNVHTVFKNEVLITFDQVLHKEKQSKTLQFFIKCLLALAIRINRCYF
jgi:hypothetical protein